MNKPLVVYHANCADGFAAAWCFWRLFKDTMDYYPGTYASKTLPDFKDRHVYLVDFSYKRAVVEEILKEAKSVTLIDHHKTAIDELKDLPGLKQYVDNNHSGAILAWMYVENHMRIFRDIGEDPPPVLAMIEDRDLWRFKWEETKPLSEFLFSHEYDFEVWDKLITADDAQIKEMVAQGRAIQKKHMKDVKETIRLTKRQMFIGGMKVPVANILPMMASDAGSIMSLEAPFAATYSDGEHARFFSLRSNKDNPNHVDVSKIAWGYGGGGHYHAAGFNVPRDHELAKT